MTGNADIALFYFPTAIGSKLYPYTVGVNTNILDQKNIAFQNTGALYQLKQCPAVVFKGGDNTFIQIRLGSLQNLTDVATYTFRIEVTFLLSDNLAA